MNFDLIIYKLLLWVVPILLTILAFIGALAVNALVKMGNDIGEIKITIKEISIKHEGLEFRVSQLEEKLK